MKYFVISQPKAGTYLCSNLLREFKLEATGIHCNGSKNYKIYRPDDPLLHRYIDSNNFDLLKTVSYKKNTFLEVLDEIGENEFAVGHVKHTELSKQDLINFKKIIVTRNYQDYADSKKRYYETYNAKVFSGTFELYSNILLWVRENNTFKLTFYDMINCNIKKIDELQLFLFDKKSYDSKECIQNALQKPSLTKSNIRK